MTTKPDHLSIAKVSQEEGIKDLFPLKCRGFFAKAVIAEREGNHEEAERLLIAAVSEQQNAHA